MINLGSTRDPHVVVPGSCPHPLDSQSTLDSVLFGYTFHSHPTVPCRVLSTLVSLTLESSGLCRCFPGSTKLDLAPLLQRLFLILSHSFFSRLLSFPILGISLFMPPGVTARSRRFFSGSTELDLLAFPSPHILPAHGPLPLMGCTAAYISLP